MKRIRVDFNMRERIGTAKILLSWPENVGIYLELGERVLLYDEEMTVEAIVETANRADFLGVIDRSTIRDLDKNGG